MSPSHRKSMFGPCLMGAWLLAVSLPLEAGSNGNGTYIRRHGQTSRSYSSTYTPRAGSQPMRMPGAYYGPGSYGGVFGPRHRPSGNPQPGGSVRRQGVGPVVYVPVAQPLFPLVPSYVEQVRPERVVRVRDPEPSGDGNPIYIVVQPGQAVSGPSYEPPRERRPAYEPPPPAPRREPPEPKKPKVPGRLGMHVQPADASVYLDDRFVGSGAEVASLDAPLELKSGVHVLEISHPDHSTERLFFGVPSAGEVLVEIDLGHPQPRRRSRVETTAP